jgi:hypothetical protein
MTKFLKEFLKGPQESLDARDHYCYHPREGNYAERNLFPANLAIITDLHSPGLGLRDFGDRSLDCRVLRMT